MQCRVCHIRNLKALKLGKCLFVFSVSQTLQTLCDPKDYTPLGSSAHGIFPGKNSGAGNPYLLQGIFPTQEIFPTSPTSPALAGFSLFLGGWGCVCAGSSQLSQLFSGCGWGGAGGRGAVALLSSCSLRSYCSGFSCCRARGLGHHGLKRCHHRVLEHRLNSCGTRD